MWEWGGEGGGVFIYLVFYIAFNTVQGHITTGSFMGGGNQYIQLVLRFCTVNC